MAANLNRLALSLPHDPLLNAHGWAAWGDFGVLSPFCLLQEVAFFGFSAESIAQRIMDCKPKVVITCNAVRRGAKPRSSSPWALPVLANFMHKDLRSFKSLQDKQNLIRFLKALQRTLEFEEELAEQFSGGTKTSSQNREFGSDIEEMDGRENKSQIVSDIRKKYEKKLAVHRGGGNVV